MGTEQDLHLIHSWDQILLTHCQEWGLQASSKHFVQLQPQHQGAKNIPG